MASPLLEHIGRPMGYSLPYGWGHFSTTEAANDAFGLVPLTAKAIKGGFDRSSLQTNAVEILLLGPNEDPVWSLVDKPRHEGFTSRTSISAPYVTAANGIHIICSFEKSRKDMLEAEIDKHAGLRGVSPKDYEAHFSHQGEIPIREYFGQLIGKTLVHELCDRLVPRLAEGHLLRKILYTPNLQQFEPISNFAAEAIAMDIHDDFCTDVFDHYFNQSLAQE